MMASILQAKPLSTPSLRTGGTAAVAGSRQFYSVPFIWGSG